MTDFHPWQSRRRRNLDWLGWLVAIIAVIIVVVAMTLIWGADGAEGAMLPPRPGTVRTLPAPAGRHELRLWCRNAPHMSAATSAACRRIGGYR